jgi:hypothetical protein
MPTNRTARTVGPKRFHLAPRRLSTMRPLSPNKSLQRSVNHKVLGRGREVFAPCRAPRARVLTGQPAAAELSR